MDKNKNLLAIAIGFFLILIVAVFSFFRPFAKKETSQKNISLKKISEDTSKLKPISSNDLLKKIRSGEKIIILDMRSQEEFYQEHILDSLNIPFSELESNIKSIKKGAQYIIIDPNMSTETLKSISNLFDSQGINNIHYLAGGFFSWKNGGNPTVSAGDPNSFVDQSKVNYINSDKLKEILSEAGNGLTIIDLRKNDSFENGHIASAVNIFLDDLEKKRSEIPLGKKIILYDDNGIGAFQGAIRLFDMGFFNVQTLSDGFNTWKQKGFETVK